VKPVELSNMTLCEQWCILSQTSLFIAQHGAALANAIFMKPSTMNRPTGVIELGGNGPFHDMFWCSSATVRGFVVICRKRKKRSRSLVLSLSSSYSN
jgi:capsular polysaccharide biosynthesis protein